MRPILAVALALLCACAEYTPGEVLPSDGNGGIPVGGGGTGGGADGGMDAGDGGSDAGDAGCNGVFDPRGYPTVDTCFNFGTTIAFITSTNCNATISFGTTPVCTGVISGPGDAFDGGCGTFACSSASLPGRVTCGSIATCSINICDAGGGCLP